MDPLPVLSLVASMVALLEFTRSTLKEPLRNLQGFEEDGIQDTLTKISTYLLFTRDILEREDMVEEVSAVDMCLLNQSLSEVQSDLLELSSVIQKGFHKSLQKGSPTRQLVSIILRRQQSPPKQYLERIQQTSIQLRNLLLKLDSGHATSIKDLNLDSSIRRPERSYNVPLRKRSIRVGVDFYAEQKKLLQLAPNGSADWLFQSPVFQDWVKAPGMILWLNGPAGSGKSFLSSLVIDHLKKKESGPTSSVGIGFLFFGSTQPSEQRLSYLIGRLIEQLKKGKSMSQTRSIGSNKTRTTLKESFDPQELSGLLQEATKPSDHTYIVLDALDQCSNEGNTRALLVDLLRQISERVHILVTSRPIIKSTNMFPGAIQLEVRPKDTALEKFVRSHVETVELPDLEKDEIVRQILKRSDGDFPAALLACKQLKDLSDQPSPERLPARLQQAPQGQAKDIPSLLGSLVDHMRDDETSMKLLQWALFCRRPLTWVEMRVAVPLLSNQPGIEVPSENLRPFRAGLLTRNSETVLLSHASFREPLMSMMDQYCSDPHSKIAITCMDYLKTHMTSENIKGLSESSNRSLVFSNAPFLDYAASNLAYHVKKAETVDTKKLAILLDSPEVSRGLSHFIGRRVQSKTTFAKDIMSGVHIVAHFGLVEVMKTHLSDNPKTIEAKTPAGRTPLHIASAAGRSKTVALLLRHGANILDQTEEEEWTPLHIAARNGRRSVTIALLGGSQSTSSQQSSQEMALLHFRDSLKRTALHLAASAGDANIVSYLLQRGSGIDDVDSIGSSPLHHAIRARHSDVVRVLLEKGPDLYRKDLVYGQTGPDLAWNWGDSDLDRPNRWESYEVDQGRSSKVIAGGQATCHVLKRKGGAGQHAKYKFVFRKTFDMGKKENENTRKYLVSEHRLLKRMNHPHIVSYLDYEEDRDRKRFSLYMEYCEGGDLEKNHRIPSAVMIAGRIDGLGFEKRPESPQSETSTAPLEEAIVWALICQLSLAMAYLHHGLNFRHGGQEAYFEKEWECVIHRDIKPANVVLEHDGNNAIIAKLCDLGHAREREVGGNGPKTQLGTVGYTAPEIARKIWTTKADIYAFGHTIANIYKEAASDAHHGHTGLQDIIQACTRPTHLERPSSIQILEMCHNHLVRIDQPARDLLPKQTLQNLQAVNELVGTDVPYLLQTFRHVSGFLDDYSTFDSIAEKKRKAIKDQLQVFFEDGAEKLFRENPDENAIHLTVLLRFGSDKKNKKKGENLGKLCKSPYKINHQWERSGLTALHIAVQEHDREMAEILLKYGADRSIRDTHSQTAEDYAMLRGYAGIDEFLKKGSFTATGDLSEIQEE